MKNPVLQFCLGVITAMALIAVALYFGLIPGLSGGTYQGPTLVVAATAPDGHYVARSERMTKGSDWCEERTIVDRVGEQSDWESEYVFMNDCGTPMTLTWAANRELLISYSYATTGKAHVYRKAYSNDGKVTINYSLEPEWLQ